MFDLLSKLYARKNMSVGTKKVDTQTGMQEPTVENGSLAYSTEGFYDEMFKPDGSTRQGSQALLEKLHHLTSEELAHRQAAADRSMLRLGITFNVYGQAEGTERIIPFDIVPRIIKQQEWAWIERGLKQRILALNMFIDDIYHRQQILKDKIIPDHVILSAASFRQQCVGLNPPKGIWCHITGTDLVRDGDGQIYILEDNLRCPSGVSYVLQNRQLMKQTFPQLFERAKTCSRCFSSQQR